MVTSSIGLQCAWLGFHVRVVDVVASMETIGVSLVPSKKSSSSTVHEIKSSHLPGGRAPSRKFHFPNPSYVRFYVSFRGGFFVERFWANQSSYEIAEPECFRAFGRGLPLLKTIWSDQPAGNGRSKICPKKRSNQTTIHQATKTLQQKHHQVKTKVIEI